MLQYRTFHAFHDDRGQGQRPVMADLLNKRFMMGVVGVWLVAVSRLAYLSTLLGSPSSPGVDAGPAEPGAVGG